ncbi:MAG: cytochrome c3 family protein [Thermoanaerobaculum sp.]|nr:cytochrome c3 family protein [Thermoanaerobaculum sp.]
MTRLLSLAALACAALALAAPPPRTVGAPGKPAQDQCTVCHRELEEARLRQPALLAAEDVHHRQGITCAGCHGGDPAATEPEVAMDPSKGFVGKIPPQKIPEVCAACHSDTSFMLRYDPNIPTDQLAQYRTSKHGLGLAKGDQRVATCASCHGAHGILPASDARSPVYPSRIVETCARCHADRSLMAQYGIPGNEIEDYQQSVHYQALTVKNDLSAPTCNDCHGAHGATPPGVSSVSNVCGTCHLTQREAFDLSPHKDAFATMEQPACEACHSNHKVVPPQDQWIGVEGGQVCGTCHSAGDAGAEAAAKIGHALLATVQRSEAVRQRVERAEQRGMLMDEALVKLEEAHQALVLARNDVHTVDPARVQARTEEAQTVLAKAEADAAAAEEELAFRHRGLKVSLVIILLTVLALGLKIREIEQRG